MKKQYRMNDLDCASCAAKMERAIRKIPGVNEANINFMTQKLTIDADEARLGEIMEQVAAACRKVEPDCTVVL